MTNKKKELLAGLLLYTMFSLGIIEIIFGVKNFIMFLHMIAFQ